MLRLKITRLSDFQSQTVNVKDPLPAKANANPNVTYLNFSFLLQQLKLPLCLNKHVYRT